MFAAASLKALKGKTRSPQTEFRRPVKQKVDYPIQKLMQDNISVKWGGKADHCIMGQAWKSTSTFYKSTSIVRI